MHDFAGTRHVVDQCRGLADPHQAALHVAALGAAGVRVGAAYLAMFAWSSGAEAWHMTEVGESTDAILYEIIIWPARWYVPLGTGLTACWMLLQAAQGMVGGSDE